MSGPYAEAAEDYWQSGWTGILPLPAREKSSPPSGWTGHGSPYPSWPDVYAWIEEKPDSNIALRLPPGVLGVDVDAYDGKPGAETLAALEAEHGALPPTWMSTSRDDGISGIRLFRVPEGINWVGSLPGIETIHTGHRYLVAAPSIHPEGRAYRWIKPDGMPGFIPALEELPELPAAWVAAFARPYPRADPADLDSEQVGTWLVGLREGAPCRPVTAVLIRELGRLAARDGGARHDICRDASRALAAFGGEGHAGVREALAALRAGFLQAATDPNHPGSTRDMAAARAEWSDLLGGAVRLAAAAHATPALICDCVTDDDLYELTGQSRPTATPSEQPAAVEAKIPLDDRHAGPDRFFHKTDGLLAMKLARAVNDEGPVAAGRTGSLYHYTDGVWQAGGDRVARQRVVDLLGDRYRMGHAATVIDIFANQPSFDDAGDDTAYLNLPNGLLDWRTGQLHSHDPAVPSTIRIPLEWDPNATCPAIEQWLSEVFPNDAREFIEEVIGYCLYNDNPLHKAILLFGRGRNGKGTFLRLLRALIGDDNVSSVTPQSLDENRFRAAELYGKLANLVGDVDPRIFKATETFKQVTGGDHVTAERKYGQPFTFYCRALLVAAFNALPRSADTSEGFFSRWIVVPFTGYFPPGVADPSREDKMHTPAELRGLLAMAVRGLARLMGRGRFDPPASVEEETTEFRRTADPVRAFLDDYVGTLITEWVPRTQVYNAYTEWSGQNGYHPVGASAFYERLEAAGSDAGTHVVAARVRQGTRGYLIRALQTAKVQEGAGGADPLTLPPPCARTRGKECEGCTFCTLPAPDIQLPAETRVQQGAPPAEGAEGAAVCQKCSGPLWSPTSKAAGLCQRCRAPKAAAP